MVPRARDHAIRTLKSQGHIGAEQKQAFFGAQVKGRVSPIPVVADFRTNLQNIGNIVAKADGMAGIGSRKAGTLSVDIPPIFIAKVTKPFFENSNIV